jgi:glycosyltransferase involved in cell wall biosynthesis
MSLVDKYDVYIVANSESYNLRGVTIVGVKNNYKGRIGRILFYGRKLYKAALNLDAEIYHIHDPELLLWARLLKRSGKIVIFDSHENYSDLIYSKSYIPRLLRKYISKLYNILETIVCRKIDSVIIPCSFNGVNVFENRAQNITMIPNYPQKSEFYNKITDTNIPFPSREYIVYIGSLTYERGVKHIAEAALLSEVKLVLGGDFRSEKLREEILNSGRYDSFVEYVGYVSRNQIYEINRKAIAGISTILNVGQYNKGDTFGVKIYEYMSMGLPVIMSDSPYARKINKQYNFAILVDPHDVNEILQAILLLKEDPVLAQKLGENGRRAIDLEFNWSIVEKELLSLYSKLLNENELG